MKIVVTNLAHLKKILILFLVGKIMNFLKTCCSSTTISLLARADAFLKREANLEHTIHKSFRIFKPVLILTLYYTFY